MRYIIEKGDVFKCIKTYRMESGEKAYTRGKEYFSEVDGCITDNELDVNHDIQDEEELFEHFKLKEVHIKCTGNNGNGCFMDSCGHNCGCEGLR